MNFGRSIVFIFLFSVSSISSVFAEEKKNIFILYSGAISIYKVAVTGFKEHLKSNNISSKIEEATLSKDEAEVKGIFKKINSKPPDLLLTIGTVASKRAQKMAPNIPQIFCMVLDPTYHGLPESGVAMEIHPADQIKFLQENIPALKSVGVLYSKDRNVKTVMELKKLQSTSNLKIVLEEVASSQDMAKAIVSISKKADCLLMVGDPVLYSPRTATQTILHTLRQNLPIITISASYVKAGALLGIYGDFKDNGRRAGELAKNYFNGKPTELFWPSKINFSVNSVVADRLKFKINQKVLGKAQQVFK